VITGYNTDIEFEGVVYHVQTEDKGLSKPIILSLVYNGGTILASKRSPYDDLLSAGFDEAELSERLNRQHRLICAAVKAGRIDDLKQMTSNPIAAGKPVTASAGSSISKPSGQPIAEPALLDLSNSLTDMPIPIPQFEPAIKISDDDNLLDTQHDISVLDEEIIVPAEAVEIISDLAEKERPVSKKLSVEFVGESDFKGGERRTVTVMVCRGSERKVVPEAQTMVKILGTSFRPIIFHAKTDPNGLAKINLQIPAFQSGRAALLIRVINEGEEIELRRSVHHG
jgi:hypothetical protein